MCCHELLCVLYWTFIIGFIDSSGLLFLILGNSSRHSLAVEHVFRYNDYTKVFEKHWQQSSLWCLWGQSTPHGTSFQLSISDTTMSIKGWWRPFCLSGFISLGIIPNQRLPIPSTTSTAPQLPWSSLTHHLRQLKQVFWSSEKRIVHYPSFKNNCHGWLYRIYSTSSWSVNIDSDSEYLVRRSVVNIIRTPLRLTTI